MAVSGGNHTPAVIKVRANASARWSMAVLHGDGDRKSQMVGQTGAPPAPGPALSTDTRCQRQSREMVRFAGSNLARRPVSYDIVAMMLAMACWYPASSEAFGVVPSRMQRYQFTQ